MQTTMVKNKHISYQNIRKINGIIFMLPWIIGFILFFIVPLINTIIYSFNNVSVGETGGMELKFAGMKNFLNLFSVEVSTSKRQFLRVFLDENAKIFINTPVIVVFSLFCAILVNSKFKGRGIARVIFFLPIILGLDVVINLITATTGNDVIDMAVSNKLDNGLLMTFLHSYTFLPKPVTTFIFSLASNVFSLISQTGVQTLIFLAGLQSINQSLYEVAKIEGATTYEVFWKITLPLLSNIFLFALVYTFVDMFLRSPITTEIYNFAFNKNNIGVGSALSLVYLINVLFDLLIMMFILNKVVKFNHA
ncbi:MAG: sugar ABC transporter permease [Clostridiales bacterium]|nr:sugar ABC transporter permease [Clostridiales bacterium]